MKEAGVPYRGGQIIFASPKWELDPEKECSFPSGHLVSELGLEPRCLDFWAPSLLGAVQLHAYRGIFPSKTNRWLLPPFRLPLLTRAWYFKKTEKTGFLHNSSCHTFICSIFMVLLSKRKSTVWLGEVFGDLQALWHNLETCRFTCETLPLTDFINLSTKLWFPHRNEWTGLSPLVVNKHKFFVWCRWWLWATQ